MNYLGIDPGASGGIALLDSHGIIIEVVQATTESEMCGLLRHLTEQPTIIAIEKVSGFIGIEHPGSAMFNFGRTTGIIIGCLLTLGKQFEEVEPRRWQGALGLRRAKGVSKQQWKRQLKDRAQQLFPDYRVTLWAADALLLARFTMLNCQGVAAIGEPSEVDPWSIDA